MLRKPPLPPPGGLPPRRPAGRSRYQSLVFDADRFFEAKDYETAFTIYAQALSEAPPGDTTALSQLCRCYRKKALKLLKREDWAGVKTLLDEMMSRDKVEPHVKAGDYKVLGEASLELGELDAAQAAFDRTLALKPELQGDIGPLLRRLKTERLSREMKGLH